MFMDDVLLNKASTLENCIKRIHEEYIGHESELASNYTRQDSIILNLQRACEVAIDMGLHIIRAKQLGIPQTAREVFVALEQSNIISQDLSKKLQSMVGFRNIAIHDYQTINLAIVKAIINQHLQDFVEFKKIVLQI